MLSFTTIEFKLFLAILLVAQRSASCPLVHFFSISSLLVVQDEMLIYSCDTKARSLSYGKEESFLHEVFDGVFRQIKRVKACMTLW